MNYTVLWRGSASSQMLTQLVRAADKQALLAAARDVERRLQLNPAGEGEGRNEEERMLFVRTLSVMYRIDETNRTVYIEELRWVGS